MALKLDLSGLFSAEAPRGVSRSVFGASLARAQGVREAHFAGLPAWAALPGRSDLRESCRRRAGQVRGEQPEIDTLVVCGIGGSALGTSAALAALAPAYQEWGRREGLRVFVLDGIDPDWLTAFLAEVDPLRCHFNVISKSGGTLETASQFLLFYAEVRSRLGSDEEARARFTLTTDPETGHLRKLGRELGFCMLEVPPGVGGRFSVLCPVGLFPLEMAGVDTAGLLAGAARTAEKLQQAGPAEDPALAYALAHVLHMEKGRRVHVHFPYSWRMRLLGDWYRQLWAESLGKRRSTSGKEVWQGATPVKALGPTDQHSQVQLYRGGPDDKVYTFVKLERFDHERPLPEPFADSPAFEPLRGRSLNELLEAERQGTEAALLEVGRPVCTLELCKLDPFHVGQYFFFLETATAYTGGLLGIDPFDQPGVEGGKQAALALMGAPGFEELAERIRSARAGREPFRLEC